MDEQKWSRVRGLKSLIHDGVSHGASFVEKHHRHATNKPFEMLMSVESLAGPVGIVQGLHDGVLSLSYGGVRVVNRVVETVDDWILDRVVSAASADES